MVEVTIPFALMHLLSILVFKTTSVDISSVVSVSNSYYDSMEESYRKYGVMTARDSTPMALYRSAFV